MNDKFEKLILASINEVKQEIKTLKEVTKPISPDNAIGRLTRMEAINEKSINEASLRNLEVRLNMLEQALVRLKDDEYGECLACGDEISDKRLKVVPEAPLCLKCATESQ